MLLQEINNHSSEFEKYESNNIGKRYILFLYLFLVCTLKFYYIISRMHWNEPFICDEKIVSYLCFNQSLY